MIPELQKLAELEAKSTKGPWFRPFPDYISIHAETTDQRVTQVLGQMNDFSDGDFVIAAKRAMPALLALAAECMAWRERYDTDDLVVKATGNYGYHRPGEVDEVMAPIRAARARSDALLAALEGKQS